MNTSVVRSCQLLATVCACVAAAVGLFGVLGWVFDVDVLKGFYVGGVSIKANAAVCLLLLAVALLLRSERFVGVRRALVASRAAAAVATVVAGLTFAEHLNGADLGIDQLLFSEPPGASATVSPGRMGPPASLSFLLAGSALLLLDVRTRGGRVPSQWLALAVGLIALLPLIGYAYSIQSLYGIAKYTGIALHTAVAIAALAVGLLAVRPTAGLMTQVVADDVGGEMCRRLLAPAVLIPLLLGWLRTLGERAGLYDASLGRPLLILSLIVSFTTLVWWNARALSALGRHRRRTEEELRDSEARLAAILDHAHAIVYVVDRDNRFQFINQRWQPVFGLTNDQVRGRSIYDFFPKEIADAMAENNRRVLSSRATEEAEEVVPHPDGDHTYISVKVPLFDTAGEPHAVCGISTDITERKRAEVELRRAKEAAERASEAKSEFLATLSHELRTPLTPVLLAVSLMERDPALPAELREDVATIRRNVELESQLISDLLDLTRITKGKLQLDEADVDLHLIIRAAVDVCLRDGAAPVTLELRATRHSVRGDGTRLQQVFWNLINNAIKFTPPDGSITVRSSNVDDRHVRVEVADTGAGIAPDVLARLFNAFEQGEARTARQHAGLGLGLTISRRLAEAHGGTVTARSEGRGHGSTFTVELPVIDPGVPAAPSDRPPDMPVAVRGLNVLLVEDHEPTLRVMERLLSKIGHRVTVATSVATATAAAANNGTFDLMISDIGLPDGSGIELMQRVRDKFAERAIALTGYGMDDDVAATREAGFTMHLTKPVDLATLDAAIREVTAS